MTNPNDPNPTLILTGCTPEVQAMLMQPTRQQRIQENWMGIWQGIVAEWENRSAALNREAK